MSHVQKCAEASWCGKHLLAPDVFICPSAPGWPRDLFSTSSLLRVKGAQSCIRTKPEPGTDPADRGCGHLAFSFSVSFRFFLFLFLFLLLFFFFDCWKSQLIALHSCCLLKTSLFSRCLTSGSMWEWTSLSPLAGSLATTLVQREGEFYVKHRTPYEPCNSDIRLGKRKAIKNN